MQPLPSGVATVQLFDRHCAACHGTKGHGDGPAAQFLFPKPRAFRDSPFRFAATGGTEQEALAAITNTIKHGLPRSGMPGFSGVLSDADVTGLAHHVADLTKLAAGTLVAAPEPNPLLNEKPVPPENSKALVDYGARLYRQMACIGCHGESGHGDGVGIAGLVDSRGMPVRPADLASGLYKSGGRDGLYRVITQGVPGTPMISYAPLLVKDLKDGTKDDTAVWALVEYIRSLAPRAQLTGASSGAELHAQTRPDDGMFFDPSHAVWLDVQQTNVTLRPIWHRTETNITVGVNVVRAGDMLAIRFAWDDATCDVTQDSGKFPDAVAVMFASSGEVPALPMGINVDGYGAAAGGVTGGEGGAPPGGPPVAAGSQSAPVNVWHWKASRQFDAADGCRHDADNPRVLPPGEYHLFKLRRDAFTAQPRAELPLPPQDQDLRLGEQLYVTAAAAGNVHSDPALTFHAALEANAIGFGTLTDQPIANQHVYASAVWASGRWFVTIFRPLPSDDAGDVDLITARRIPVAFAVWNGSKGDRDGVKLISGWHWLVIDPQPGAVSPAPGPAAGH